MPYSIIRALVVFAVLILSNYGLSSPLHEVIGLGDDVEALNSVLSRSGWKKVNVNERKHGLTPIVLAAQLGRWAIVRRLLEVKDVRLDPALLHHFDDVGGIDIFQSLLPSVDPNFLLEGETPLMVAARRRLVDFAVQLLADPRTNPNLQDTLGNTVLHRVVLDRREGMIDLLRILLGDPRTRIDLLNRGGNAPFHEALRLRDNQLVVLTFLELRPGAVDVRTRGGEHPLFLAFQNDLWEIVRRFLDQRPDLVDVRDERGDTVFFWRGIPRDLYQRMIRLPAAELNWARANGETALHAAAAARDAARVEDLLTDPRINRNAQTLEGNTPLHTAANIGDVEVARLLLDDPHTNPNAMANGGRTPLHFAANRGGAEVAQLLLANPRINVNALASAERPIHTALRFGRRNVALLLARDPRTDLLARNGTRQTPLELVGQDGNLAEVILLHLPFHLTQDELFVGQDTVDRKVRELFEFRVAILCEFPENLRQAVYERRLAPVMRWILRRVGLTGAAGATALPIVLTQFPGAYATFGREWVANAWEFYFRQLHGFYLRAVEGGGTDRIIRDVEELEGGGPPNILDQAAGLIPEPGETGVPSLRTLTLGAIRRELGRAPAVVLAAILSGMLVVKEPRNP